MARNPLPYSTTNVLSKYIAQVQAEITLEQDGDKITIKEVEALMGTYCHVTRDSISAIKRDKQQPSVAVAMKILEFLRQYYPDLAFEDIFTLTND